jgi:hypothetical protein
MFACVASFTLHWLPFTIASDRGVASDFSTAKIYYTAHLFNDFNPTAPLLHHALLLYTARPRHGDCIQ